MSSSMTTSVTLTLHNEDADRCVKIIKRSDGTFGFTEFRRDPEDAGGWTLVGDHPQAIPTEQEAVAAARAGVGWLHDMTPAAAGTASMPPRPQGPEKRVGRPGVVVSLHNDAVDRCVDIIRHPDGTFGI